MMQIEDHFQEFPVLSATGHKVLVVVNARTLYEPPKPDKNQRVRESSCPMCLSDTFIGMN